MEGNLTPAQNCIKFNIHALKNTYEGWQELATNNRAVSCKTLDKRLSVDPLPILWTAETL
eukprot:3325903-Amphidinium_carterae.1